MPRNLLRRYESDRDHVNIEHRAASGVGARITTEAIRSHSWRYKKWTARDDEQEIGRGTVGRAVVSVGKFLEKMKKAPGN
jgi:predicted thioesterase